MIYITVIAAVIVIPIELGGYGKIFAAVPAAEAAAGRHRRQSRRLQRLCDAGPGLGAGAVPLSAFDDRRLSARRSRHVIRRNAALLPAYSFLLGLIALLGYMALAAGVDKMPAYAAGFKIRRQFRGAGAVPADVPVLVRRLRLRRHRHRRAGAGGDHVDRRGQSVHPQHLPRVHQPELHADAGSAAWPRCVSLVVKLGALFFIIFLPTQYAIQLQLLGGIWIIQTLPAVIFGLYTRWLNSWALLIGWAVGMVAGTAMAASHQFHVRSSRCSLRRTAPSRATRRCTR